jgi:hypothetical protein
LEKQIQLLEKRDSSGKFVSHRGRRREKTLVKKPTFQDAYIMLYRITDEKLRCFPLRRQNNVVDGNQDVLIFRLHQEDITSSSWPRAPREKGKTKSDLSF